MQRMRPRAMMAIRSPRMSASSMECVVSTRTRPALHSSITSHTYLAKGGKGTPQSGAHSQGDTGRQVGSQRTT